MIYLKIPKEEFAYHLHECQDDFNVDIYNDFFYSKCPKCDKTVKLDIEDIRHILETGGDFTTSIYCTKCSIK